MLKIKRQEEIKKEWNKACLIEFKIERMTGKVAMEL